MPKSPKQILAARETNDAVRAAELCELIETAIEHPERGYSGEPWSYFIDTSRYPLSVVQRVRRSFAEAGWNTTSGHPMDSRDNGYDLVFTAAGEDLSHARDG